MKIEDFIGDKATYDPFGQKIFGVKGKGKDEVFQMIADLRGWGAIQNLFLDKKGALDEKAAGKFQDDMGQWIADAISEKLSRTKSPYTFTPMEYINRSALEKGRDYFVVTESGHIIQAHYTMITETEGDFFGKDTNEFYKVTQIDLNYVEKPSGHPC